jgi:hypothetical protein
MAVSPNFLSILSTVRSGKSRSHKRVVPISDCDACTDLADQAFETGSDVEIGQIAVKFLQHAVNEHTGEVMAVLAEKYGPIFLSKRAMR